MNKPSNWDATEAFTGDFKTITPGGHVCQIKQAKVDTTTTGKEVLILLFDISEGECKDFYAEQCGRKKASNADAKWQGIYRQLTQDKSLPFFKGLITAIEKSNNGYTWNWDEKTLAGKLFGGVFGQEEYINNNGEIKLATKCMAIRSVEQIRNGVEVPPIKKLKQIDDSFASFGTDVDENIPF